VALLTTVGERTLYTTQFPLMGGPAIVRFVDDRGRERAESIARAAENEAYRIERKFSRFREESLLSEIARAAGKAAVAVDDETVALVESALDLARLTAGKFDPTIGVLRRAWNFREPRIPDDEDLAAILPLVDYRAVSVAGNSVLLAREGMELDLGGVGKEYAVDRVAEVLVARGVTSALINFAGDIRTIGGRGDGRPWSIGVADPRAPGTCRFAVRLIGGAGVATSGDYERCFVKDGVRYHHLLDATTGWPARGVMAATVVAATAFAAGRIATAAFLLGPREGVALIERFAGVEGCVIDATGDIATTAGMSRVSNLPGSLFAAYPAL
jgi:thiamine biosynthesis lipoprotein